jgi:hypothetical protein
MSGVTYASRIDAWLVVLVSPRDRERFIDELRLRVVAAGGRLMEPLMESTP